MCTKDSLIARIVVLMTFVRNEYIWTFRVEYNSKSIHTHLFTRVQKSGDGRTMEIQPPDFRFINIYFSLSAGLACGTYTVSSVMRRPFMSFASHFLSLCLPTVLCLFPFISITLTCTLPEWINKFRTILDGQIIIIIIFVCGNVCVGKNMHGDNLKYIIYQNFQNVCFDVSIR